MLKKIDLMKIIIIKYKKLIYIIKYEIYYI